MVATDLPTQDEFEEAQDALYNDDPELAPHFAYWHHVDEDDWRSIGRANPCVIVDKPEG